MAKFLTFDLGTTLFKIALFDDSGRLLAVERISVPRTQLGSSEVDPDRFKLIIIDATRALRLRVPELWADISAVSFATQANSFLLLDLDHRPVTNIILWTDDRAAGMRRKFHQISSHREFHRKTGMPAFGPALGLAKAMWLHDHQPEVFARASHFRYLSDYFTHWMTGRDCTEAGVAGLSGALDIRSHQWWRWGHEAVPETWLPPVARAGTELGPITPEMSAALELRSGCPFVIGCLDQYAGAIGTGSVESGMISETTGTVLAAVRCSNRFEDHLSPHVYQGPAFSPGWFYQMSFSSTSANLLELYRNQLANKPSFEALSRLAESAAPGGPIIAPYEGLDRERREPIELICFRDVRSEHTPGQVVRAIMQRVAQSLNDQVQWLSSGKTPTEIRSAGGGARSDTWLQIKADTLGIPVVALECEEPTSLGAAMLAACAIGLGDLPSLAKKWIKIRRRFVPNSRHSE